MFFCHEPSTLFCQLCKTRYVFFVFILLLKNYRMRKCSYMKNVSIVLFRVILLFRGIGMEFVTFLQWVCLLVTSKPSFPEVTSWKVRTVRISLIFLMDFFHFNFFSTFHIDESQNEIIVTLQPHTSDFQNQDSWGNFFQKWPSQWFPLWNFVILGYFMVCR